jgi:hypothetical protein
VLLFSLFHQLVSEDAHKVFFFLPLLTFSVVTSCLAVLYLLNLIFEETHLRRLLKSDFLAKSLGSWLVDTREPLDVNPVRFSHFFHLIKRQPAIFSFSTLRVRV